MQTPNYFSGIVKILENPKVKIYKEKIRLVKCRVLLPQVRKNKKSKVISVIFCNTLKTQTENDYKVGDYIMIEGYGSINNNMVNFNNKIMTFTVLRSSLFLFRRASNNSNYQSYF